VNSFGNTALLPLAEVMPSMYALRNWVVLWIRQLSDVPRRAGQPSVRERVREKIKKWLRYVENTYRRLFPLAEWNVYQALMKGQPWTTNDNEAYNRAIGAKVGKSRPSLSRCVLLLRAEEEKVHRRSEAAGAGPIVAPNPRSHQMAAIRKIREVIQAFEAIQQKSDEDRLHILREIYAVRMIQRGEVVEIQPEDAIEAESSDEDEVEEEGDGLARVDT
jgi:hypothetical protein